MLIDTHAHLTDEKFNSNIDALIKDLDYNGIDKVFTVAYNKETIISSVELARKYPQVYAIIGIHPDSAEELDDSTLELIKKLAQEPKVIGIGEIGLDYHWRTDNKDIQKEAFVKQIRLAYELQLPISIHNRDSIGDMLPILKENKEFLKYGGVMHCYSESVEIYKEIKISKSIYRQELYLV